MTFSAERGTRAEREWKRVVGHFVSRAWVLAATASAMSMVSALVIGREESRETRDGVGHL